MLSFYHMVFNECNRSLCLFQIIAFLSELGLDNVYLIFSQCLSQSFKMRHDYHFPSRNDMTWCFSLTWWIVFFKTEINIQYFALWLHSYCNYLPFFSPLFCCCGNLYLFWETRVLRKRKPYTSFVPISCLLENFCFWARCMIWNLLLVCQVYKRRKPSEICLWSCVLTYKENALWKDALESDKCWYVLCLVVHLKYKKKMFNDCIVH